jgi:hypothetical protein
LSPSPPLKLLLLPPQRRGASRPKARLQRHRAIPVDGRRPSPRIYLRVHPVTRSARCEGPRAPAGRSGASAGGASGQAASVPEGHGLARPGRGWVGVARDCCHPTNAPGSDERCAKSRSLLANSDEGLLPPRIDTEKYLTEIKRSEDLLTPIAREAMLRRRQLGGAGLVRSSAGVLTGRFASASRGMSCPGRASGFRSEEGGAPCAPVIDHRSVTAVGVDNALLVQVVLRDRPGGASPSGARS